ncbi:hypothetical protein ACWF99_23455 [Nocardia sp. NPDC055002]
MKTATIHPVDTHGHVQQSRGLARIYKLSEPRNFDGTDHEYVLVRIVYPSLHMDGEVGVFPATETGAVAERSLKRRVGSFTLDGNPNKDPAYIEGCFTWSLASLGYTIE